jgi:hypothetical protein
MKMTLLLALSVSMSVCAGEVDRLLNEYSPIETVSCKIRRTVDGAGGSMRFISRVYWQNDDKLHADNLTPVPRRIISDGDRFYSYAKGDPKGFSRPVSGLSEMMLRSLRKIPGTAMDHLLLLKGSPEEELAAKDGLRQVGVRPEGKYVVLGIDEAGRLARMDFFKTGEMKEKIAGYEYSGFSEVLPSVWVPMLHQAGLTTPDGATYTETIRVDEFYVNRPIAASLFDSSIFFDKNIDFADSFSEIYP